MEFLLLGFLGSIASGLNFNVKGYKLIFTGLSGVTGLLAFTIAMRLTNHSIISTFIGALLVGFYSETAARLLRSPSTVFSIPGILPLVPGTTAYEAVRYLTNGDLNNASGKIVAVINGAGAIAFGILLVTAIFRFLSGPKASRR